MSDPSPLSVPSAHPDPAGPAGDRPLNKRQQQAAATRERMLAAARHVFETRGYQAASVATITREAATAHGTFYLYFRNKDDAFAQVIGEVAEQMRTESRARLTDDRYAGVEGVIRGALTVFARHPGLWRAFLEGMMASPEVEALWLEVTGDFTDRIARRLEREQQAGAVRASLDPSAAAAALSSMTQWYGFGRLAARDVVAPEDGVEDAVRTVADLWFHAVYGVTEHDR